MKRIIFHIILLCLAGTVFFSCQSGDDNSTEPLSDTDITAFSINGCEGKAIIDAEKKTVYLQIPSSVKSGSNLCPEFSLSEGASASVNNQLQTSGHSKVDFKSVVTYTITAGNKTDQSQWKITVTNNDYSTGWGLGCFITEEHSNDGNSPDGFYLQQHNTGASSDNNCGPTCAVMAARWANPTFPSTVENARDEIPRSTVDGGMQWFPQDVQAYLGNHGITISMMTLNQIEDQFVTQVTNELKNGHLVLICLDMQYVTFDKSGNPEYRINKFYNGTTGHFLVIKGYKIADGVVWMEVHDPWGMDLKYADGSYKGASRYYRAGELSIATTKHNTNAVVIYAN